MARIDQRLSPARAAPIFLLTGLFHLASVATLFDEVARRLPGDLRETILFAQFPLLLLAGYFEGRIDYGTTLAELPLWMRIQSRPVKWSFTFAFIYLSLYVLQVWDVSVGPVDPTPPPEWPLAQRAAWFAMFTVGLAFPNYLAATSLLVPLLRVVTAPLRWLPAVLGAPAAATLGAVAGYAVVDLFGSARVGGAMSWLGRLTEDPAIAVGLVLLVVVLPLVLGSVFRRRGTD